MASRIRIKMGQIEVEYEGADEFLKEELPELLRAVADLHKAGGNSIRSDEDDASSNGAALPSSVSGYAAKLRASSGPKLIISAAAKLALTDKKDSFARDELLSEMKGAKSFYKQTYSKNLTAYLSSLVKDHQLNELGNEMYALPEERRAALEKEIANT